MQGVRPHLAADAALLITAERNGVRHQSVIIHPDRAGPEPGGHAMRPLQIVRPHRGRKAVRRVVGDLESLSLFGKPDQRRNRTEDFFARHPAAVAHIAENRRLDKITLAIHTLAAGQDSQTLSLLGNFEITQNLLVLHLVGERAKLRLGIERVADDHLASLRDHLLGDLVINAVLDENARAGHAGLTGR